MNPYEHRSWAAARAHWRRLQRDRGFLVCERCGKPISRAVVRGDWSLDVGHIVAVAHAKQLGWSVEEMNAIGNTQPEHQKCNRVAGAVLGNRLRARARPAAPVTTRRW